MQATLVSKETSPSSDQQIALPKEQTDDGEDFSVDEDSETYEDQQEDDTPRYQFVYLPPELPDQVHIKKVKKLAPYVKEVKECCYIPEHNLIIILLNQGKIAVMYSSVSFKAMKHRRFVGNVRLISYSPEMNKLLLGGIHLDIEICDPISFKTEAKRMFEYHHEIYQLKFLMENKTIIAATTKGLYVFSTSPIPLVLLQTFLHPIYDVGIPTNITQLNADWLLILANIGYKDLLYICNVAENKFKCCKNIVIPSEYCIEATEKASGKFFTCLARGPDQENSTVSNSVLPALSGDKYNLVQFVFDEENERVVISRVVPNKKFVSLVKIKNSEYFAAEFVERGVLKNMLMRILDNSFEFIKTVVPPDYDIFKFRILAMLNQPSLMIGTNAVGSVCIFRYAMRESKDVEEDG